MSTLDQQAVELREIVQEIAHQFQAVDRAAANGPFASLNLQELRVVELLGEQGPRMMREVAGFVGVAVNSATGIVDGLEAKGLLRRQRSAEDRRVVRVELTDAGRGAFQSCADCHVRFNRSILHALDEGERESFLVLLRKIAQAGRSQVERLATAGAGD